MNKIQIVYCTDENYIEMAEMSAQTVLKHNQNCDVTIISQKPIKTKYNNIIINLDKYNFRLINNYYLTKATYLRYFIPQYINKSKIIYLDCDTICRGSLEQLWNMNVQYIGIAHGHDFSINQSKEFDHYLWGNDGVLIMNLDSLRKINFTKFIYSFDANVIVTQYWSAAETILNYIFYDKFTFINTKWNCCFNRSYSQFKNQNININNAIIIHFIGKDKTKFKQFYYMEIKK